ncbi:S8 family serine peptidase, partial [Treponema sp. R6D11]
MVPIFINEKAQTVSIDDNIKEKKENANKTSSKEFLKSVPHVANTVIAQVRDGKKKSVLLKYDAIEVSAAFDKANIFIAKFDESIDLSDILTRLNRDPDINFAEPDIIFDIGQASASDEGIIITDDANRTFDYNTFEPYNEKRTVADMIQNTYKTNDGARSQTFTPPIRDVFRLSSILPFINITSHNSVASTFIEKADLLRNKYQNFNFGMNEKNIQTDNESITYSYNPGLWTTTTQQYYDFFGNSSHLGRTGFYEAWKDYSTGAGSVIAIAEAAVVDFRVPDLFDNIWTNPGEYGWDSDGNRKETNGIDDDGNGFADDVYGFVGKVGLNQNNLYQQILDNTYTRSDLHGVTTSSYAAAKGNNYGRTYATYSDYYNTFSSKDPHYSDPEQVEIRKRQTRLVGAAPNAKIASIPLDDGMIWSIDATTGMPLQDINGHRATSSSELKMIQYCENAGIKIINASYVRYLKDAAKKTSGGKTTYADYVNAIPEAYKMYSGLLIGGAGNNGSASTSSISDQDYRNDANHYLPNNDVFDYTRKNTVTSSTDPSDVMPFFFGKSDNIIIAGAADMEVDPFTAIKENPELRNRLDNNVNGLLKPYGLTAMEVLYLLNSYATKTNQWQQSLYTNYSTPTQENIADHNALIAKLNQAFPDILATMSGSTDAQKLDNMISKASQDYVTVKTLTAADVYSNLVSSSFYYTITKNSSSADKTTMSNLYNSHNAEAALMTTLKSKTNYCVEKNTTRAADLALVLAAKIVLQETFTLDNLYPLKVPYSNFGTQNVDVYACMEGVGYNDQYSLVEDIKDGNAILRPRVTSGTSFAAPQVAGLAALIWDYYPSLTNLQVKKIICLSSTRQEYVPEIKYGVINAERALKLAEALKNGASWENLDATAVGKLLKNKHEGGDVDAWYTDNTHFNSKAPNNENFKTNNQDKITAEVGKPLSYTGDRYGDFSSTTANTSAYWEIKAKKPGTNTYIKTYYKAYIENDTANLTSTITQSNWYDGSSTKTSVTLTPEYIRLVFRPANIFPAHIYNSSGKLTINPTQYSYYPNAYSGTAATIDSEPIPYYGSFTSGSNSYLNSFWTYAWDLSEQYLATDWVEISRETPKITNSPTVKTDIIYSGGNKTLTSTNTTVTGGTLYFAVVDKDEPEPSRTNTSLWQTGYPLKQNAGEYDVYYYAKATNTAYVDSKTFFAGTATISPKEIVPTITSTIPTYTYSGIEIIPTTDKLTVKDS